MKKTLTILSLILLISSLAFASAHDEAAATFFRLNTPETNISVQLSENYDAVQEIFLDGLEQSMGISLSAKDREPMRQFLDYVMEIGVDYNKLQELSIPIIKSQFSEAELKELNRFLQTKAGSKYLEAYIFNKDNYLKTAIQQTFDNLAENEALQAQIEAKFNEVYGVYSDPIVTIGDINEVPTETERDINFMPYDEAPQVIGVLSPVYPDSARKAGIQGTVVLEVEVYKDGVIGSIRLRRSVQSGFGGLDEAAMEALRALKFKPGKADGKPVDTTVLIPIEFSLK